MVWVPDQTIVRHDPPLVSVGRSGGNVASIRNDRERWWLKGGVRPDQCVAAYQPIRAASLLASYINLANPGKYNAAPGVAPTFDASTGWIFDGTTQYLDTSIYAENSQWSMIIGGGPARAGASDFSGTPYKRFSLLATTPTGAGYGAGSGNEVGSNNIITHSIAIAGLDGYANGIYDISGTGSWTGAGTKTVNIGAINTTIGRYFYQGLIKSLAIYNITLTAAQVSAITTAMKAL